jgi:hypothetical protein
MSSDFSLGELGELIHFPALSCRLSRSSDEFPTTVSSGVESGAENYLVAGKELVTRNTAAHAGMLGDSSVKTSSSKKVFSKLPREERKRGGGRGRRDTRRLIQLQFAMKRNPFQRSHIHVKSKSAQLKY